MLLLKNIKQVILWILKNTKSSTIYVIGIILIGSILSILSVSQAMISKSLIDSATLGDSSLIKKWIAVLAVLLLTQVVLRSVQTIATTYCSETIKNKIQKSLYSHIIKSSWLDTSKYHSVDFLTRSTNDVSTITNMISTTIPQIVSLVVMLVTAFFALLTISPMMSLLAISIFPFLIILSRLYGRKLKKYYVTLQQKESFYSRFMQESFSNLLIVKTFCLEENKFDTIRNLQKDKLSLSMKRSAFSCVSNGLLSFCSMFGYFIVFAWGALNLSSGANMFGSLTAMLQLFSSIQSPLYGLSVCFPQLISAFGAAERLIEIEKMSLEEPKNPLDIKSYDNNTNLRLSNVSFSYIKGKEIINDVSLNIESGETIALIGPSGEGKTTLIRILLSLIHPDSGEVLVNDENLNNSHRDLISYVPQGNTLFSGSILENLRFGNPDATIEEIIDKLKMASAFDFVDSFDNKINTVIGEKGIGISEGQAQRLTIARALLRKTPILILDEATSSLDPKTEIKVLNEIKNLDYKPTCIIITHRPTALSICDKVYKLENKTLSEVNNETLKETAVSN